MPLRRGRFAFFRRSRLTMFRRRHAFCAASAALAFAGRRIIASGFLPCSPDFHASQTVFDSQRFARQRRQALIRVRALRKCR